MIKKSYCSFLAAMLLPLTGVANAEIDGQSLPTTKAALVTPNTLQIGYSVDDYSAIFEKNPILSLQYGRVISWGSLSLRASAADRYQNQDTQYEIDAYPKLWNGGYAELNMGVSSGRLFPHDRQGAEIFSSLGNGYEGSLGVRHLAFTNSSITIYTGSFSKYTGDYLLTFRPYITPSNDGTSVSAGIKITRYFADADRYLRFSASTGKSADEQKFANVLPQAVPIRSHSFGLAGQWSPRQAVFVALSFSHTQQGLVFDPSKYVGIDSFSITTSRRF